MNLLRLVSNHSPFPTRTVSQTGWTASNHQNEASACHHLIREEREKEASGGGREEPRQEMTEETMATRMEDRQNSKMIEEEGQGLPAAGAGV